MPEVSVLNHVLRVQVIDPDPVARRRITAYLRATGLEVQAATDAVGALAQMRQAAPDVLLLDPAVPRSRSLRLQCTDVPVLVLSAEPNLAQAMQDLGAWAALAKPTDFDVVAAVLRRIAGRGAPRLVSSCKGYPPSRSPRRPASTRRTPSCAPARGRAERRSRLRGGP